MVTPAGTSTRPTTDRVREAVFNSLGSAGVLDGALVADLFAGSGAIGIEALSRGAERCVFVERDRKALRALDDNLDALDLRDRSKVVAADAVSAAATIDADIVFADPPYDFDDWAQLLGRVARRPGRGRIGFHDRAVRRLGVDPGEAVRPHPGHVPRTARDRRCRVWIPMTTGPTQLRVLYPGSFDPIHLGHVDIIEQAHELFGSVVVAVMHNLAKPSGLFPVDERVELARAALAHLDGVTVVAQTGLAVQAASRADVDFIVKGLRTPGDFEIEQQMAHNNYAVTGIRTVYLPCRPEFGYISSRFVREIAKYGGAIDHLVPAPIADALRRTFDGDQN